MIRKAIAIGLMLQAGLVQAAGEGVSAVPMISFGRIAIGTIAVVGLMLITARYLTRFAGARGVASGVFRVIASLQVGQRERVVVVQVGDRQVLLGVAPGRVGLIQELAEPLQDAAGVAPKAPAFNAPTWVQRVLSKPQ